MTTQLKISRSQTETLFMIPEEKQLTVIPHECDYASIRHEINYAYEFRNRMLRDQFLKFNRQQNDGSVFLLFILILFLVLAFPSSIRNILQDVMRYSEPHFAARLITALITIMSTFGTVVCCVMIQIDRSAYVRRKLHQIASIFGRSSRITYKIKTTSLTYCYLVTQIQLFFVTVFIRRSFSLNCALNSSSAFSVLGGGRCFSPEDRGQFLSYNALMMITVPMMVMASIPEASVFWVWVVLFASMVVFIATCVIQSSVPSIVTVFFWMILLVFVIRDIQIKKIMMFFTNRRSKDALIENDRIQAENHANEMRHMIANVAHDLKTPLSSFTTGVEYIQSTIQDCLAQSTFNSMLLREQLASMNTCLYNIHNTNAFMLMTINRCIDYTKASQGLKLIPKYETINLLETLDLPLSCMHNIQNHVAIQLKSIPTRICTHIITDKQWLQENILCLLSNAVKYSNDGIVTVTVSLAATGPESDDAVSLQEENNNVTTRVHNLHSNGISNVAISHKTKTSKVLPSTMVGTEQMTVLATSEENVDDVISVSMESQATNKVSSTGINKRKDFSVSSGHDEVVNSNENMMLRFEIEDTGIGMSEEAMKSLFSPFKQNQRLAGGTGLGLYSLSKRVDALNGTYGVQKRRDGAQGSLFWFAFPYRPDQTIASVIHDHVNEKPDEKISSSVNIIPAVSIASLSSSSKGSKLQSQIQVDCDQLDGNATAGLKILLVDDTPTITKMTTLMLKKLGHNVTAAENGQLAINLIIDKWKKFGEKYDVILMDLQMPVMDGLEATRRLRLLEQPTDEVSLALPKNTILGVSANSDDETVAEALSAGVDGFLSKPFNAAALLSTLEKCTGFG